MAFAAAAVLVLVGVLALSGVDIPLVNTLSAVLLILSGLFLLGSVIYARRQSGHQPARSSGGRRLR